MRILVLGVLTAMVVSWAPSAFACVHMMKEGGAESGVKSIDAAVFHDGSKETLIFQVGVNADAEKVAWVVPVPTPPTDYDVAPENTFGAIAKYVSVTEVTAARMRGEKSKAAKVYELPNANAGPYTFQPVAVQGEKGAKTLNDWLKVKGFEPLDEKRLKYYVDRNWTFLVIRIDGRSGELGEGDLPPIQITFDTPVPVVPLKLLAIDDEVPVRIYAFTMNEYSEDHFKNAVKKQGFKLPLDPRKGPKWKLGEDDLRVAKMSFYVSNTPEPLKSLFGKIYGAKRGHVYTLVHDGLSAKDVRKWKQDFYLSPKREKLMYEPVNQDASLPPAKHMGKGDSQPAPAPAAAPETPDMGADMPAVEAAEEVDLEPSKEELDYTLVAGVIAVVFFLAAVVGVNLRRLR